MKTEEREILVNWARGYNRPEPPGESDNYDMAYRQRAEVFAAFLVGEINEDAAMDALSIRTEKTFERDLGQTIKRFLDEKLITVKRTPAFSESWEKR